MSRKSRRKHKQGPTLPPAEPMKGGRKTVLTPEIQTVIVEAARKGTPITFLGPLAGVRRATVFDWVKKGQRVDNPPYTAFADALKAAQSAFVAERVAKIAAQTAWQADAWLLERMFRAEFGSDKTELLALKKELRELRALVVQVPRETAETDAERGGEVEGGSRSPAELPAAPSHP
jgi:hypothetical protein